MAYIRRYTGDYCSHNNKDYEISIYSENGTGLDAELQHLIQDGLTLQWEGGDLDDPLYPIVSSTMDMTLVVTENNDLTNVRAFAGGLAGETYVKMKDKDSDWTWYGHIIPNEVSYEITDGPTEVRLAFNDGLAMLKDKEYRAESTDFNFKADETDGEGYQPGRTMLGMLNTLLSKIPWYNDVITNATNPTVLIQETPVLKHTKMTGAVTQARAVLPTVSAHPSAFEMEKREERKPRIYSTAQFSNCYDVVGDIVQTLGYKVCWNGYNWHCYAPMVYPQDVSASGISTFKFTKLDFTNSPGGRLDGTVSTFSPVDLDDKYAIEAGSDINFITGKRSYLGVHQNGADDSLHKWVAPGAPAGFSPSTPEYQRYLDKSRIYRWTDEDDWNNRYGTSSANGMWSSSDDTVFIEADTKLNTRLKFTMNWDDKFDRNDGAAVMIGFAVMRLEVGTANLANPSILTGDFEKYSTPFTYRRSENFVANNTLLAYTSSLTTLGLYWAANWLATGAAVNTDQYMLDPTQLDEITWSDTSVHPGVSGTDGGFVYLPIFWNGDYTSESAPEITVFGKTYRGTVHQQPTSNESKFKFDDSSHQVTFDFDVSLPGVPFDSYGYDLKVGFAGTSGIHADKYFDFHTITGELNPYFDDMGQALFRQKDGNSGSAKNRTGLCMSHLDVNRIELYMGDGGGGDRVFKLDTNEEEYDQITLIDTRIARPQNDAFGTQNINMHNVWSISSSEGTGDWTYFTDFYLLDFADDPTYLSTASSNISKLIAEFRERFSDGIHNPRLSLYPRLGQEYDILTPDMPYTTDCIMGAESLIVFDNIRWDITTGVDVEGITYNQEKGAVIVTPTEEANTDGRPRGKGGRGIIPEEDLNKLGPAATNSGDTFKYDSGTGKWAVLAAVDGVNKWDGTASTVTTKEGGWDGAVTKSTTNETELTNAAGTYPSLTDRLDGLELPDLGDVDDNAAAGYAEGIVLRYNNANSRFESANLSVDDLAETQSSFDNALLQYDASANGGSGGWVMNSPQTALGSAVQLHDLADVDGSMTPANGEILKYISGQWTSATETVASLAIDNLTDVSISNAVSRAQYDLIEWDGTSNYVGVTASDFKRRIAIEDLKDFEFAGTPGSGDTIEWDGSEWTFAANGSGGGGGAADLHDLTDVTISSYVAGSSSPSNGKILLTETGTFKDIDLTTATTDYVDVEDLKNVNATGRATGDLMYFNGTNWTPIDLGSLANSALYGMNHADLNDTTITGLGAGQFLYYNGGTWVNQTVNEVRAHLSLEDSDIDARIAAANITDLNDVTSAPTGAGEILYFNGSGWQNAALTVATGLHVDLADLKDTTIGTLSTGEYIRWNGSAWVNSNPAILAGSITLQNIGNVTNSPVDGEFLKWDGSNWVTDSVAGGSSTLDDVTTNGNTTTNSITTGNHDINVTSLTEGLKITNTDSTSGVWSAIQLHRDSSSPLDEDNICSINFNGDDSAGVATTYAAVQAVLRDSTNGTEDGGLLFRAKANNSWTNAIEINGDDTSPRTTINSFPSTSTALEIVNAGGTAGLNVEFNADMETTSTNTFSFNYVDAAGDARNFVRVEDAKTIVNNRTASSSVEIRSNDTVAGSTGEFTNATFKAADDGTNGDINTVFGDHQSVAFTVDTNTAGSWSAYTNTTAGLGTGNWVLLGAHNSDAVVRTDITGGNVKLVTQDGVFVGNSVTDTGGYTLPGQDGTANQVLQTDGSGNVSWATASGGSSNPRYNFDQTCYNSVTTTTDTYYWLPGSSTYGFEFYDNNELSTLSTSATWNRYKKMSHRLPAGTYDMDIYMDMSVSASTGGTSHASDYAGDTVNVYVYKVAHTSNGNCTVTQIGTTNLTLNATDTAAPSTATISLSGQSIAAGERVMVVCKGNTVAAGTRYAHWAYDIDAEKTA